MSDSDRSNPLAEAGARRRAETEGRYLLRWQIAAYEAILISAVVGAAGFDLWLSQAMTGSDSALFEALRTVEDMGDSQWFLVTAGCWVLGCLMLIRLTGDAARIATLKWLVRAQIWLLASIAVSGILANVFKWIFGRARPEKLEPGLSADWSLLSGHWGWHSFPSGHATTLFAAAFVLGSLFPRLRLFVFGCAIAGGLGRVAIGAHFPSDIVAGAMLGIFSAWWLKGYLERRGISLEPVGS